MSVILSVHYNIIIEILTNPYIKHWQAVNTAIYNMYIQTITFIVSKLTLYTIIIHHTPVFTCSLIYFHATFHTRVLFWLKVIFYWDTYNFYSDILLFICLYWLLESDYSIITNIILWSQHSFINEKTSLIDKSPLSVMI